VLYTAIFKPFISDTMFEKVSEAEFIRGEHRILKFWQDRAIFKKLRTKIAGNKHWNFLDGPITANNPMGVHHAWGRTYKDAFQRFFAMKGYDQRFQNGFDCQGLWVEVEVEKQLGLGTKKAINEFGIDKFVNECKKRVLKYAARQTEQSIRLGFWMDWDNPDTLRNLAEHLGSDDEITITTPSEKEETGKAHLLVSKLGNPEWGGSYFTFSTENNETIWAFLKKCFDRKKIYRGYDVMPWSGRGGSAYSQMEVADGRKLTVHKSVFVRFPITNKGREGEAPAEPNNEYLLVWTTTPWTLTSNVVAAVNPDLDYIKLRTKRDDAVYYFAKDNLESPRMEREFREGFGRPEWSWPKDVPKLKTLAQIFKEQGGYEVEKTIKGKEMIGWEYEGPFDELEAQQQMGGIPIDENLGEKNGVNSHRVIDGGRDSRGNPHVVAGEGTGIVHIAPGCGDVDRHIGAELGLPVIAPLLENGTYSEGFGEFTGKEAIHHETAEMVFKSLKEKHRLVYVEDYPHIYPHCWRTGEELVFRLVDEWFINMNWREEIKDVTRAIRWLPESVDGKERELEWLTNMRDWMISKKRFWGLALPIWVDPEDPTDFEVIGSLAELKERAIEGWEKLEGHTPHRPWIDFVKIQSKKTGKILSRIVDVGNPWLDAGIVAFSTMHYNTNREEWNKWFPADLVLECFPGQFRNWFYSLLSLSTMMRSDETDDPKEKRPFKTLFGHRLVMNEEGKPMHKTDGTAIWFEEAAEQLGVDTLRWLYLAQNPAADLRFGTRHPDEPVTLETPDGPITETQEGVQTCLVTSKPSDETRRQVLIPLWNSYAFFVNYARLDEFDPTQPAIPVEERPEIDRWILSNLQALISVCDREFAEYNTAEVCRKATAFIDDLSNWYIRRNRRRFWRSRDAGDSDKLAAYQTLHRVLVTLCQLLAPCIPFLTERMYRNLVDLDVREGEAPAEPQRVPESVHLCDYPQVDESLLDPDLNTRMAISQLVVKMGHKLREEQSLRVRQPLSEMQFASSFVEKAEAVESLAEVIREELNVKQLTRKENLDDKVSYSFKPNLKTLGPKCGKLLGAIRQQLPQMDAELLTPLRNGSSVTVEFDGIGVTLEPDDVLVSTEQATDWVSADDSGVQIALSTVLTPELRQEGMRNDFIRQVQQLRKDADLEIQDRIRICFHTEEDELVSAIEEWKEFIANETLADAIDCSTNIPPDTKPSTVGTAKISIRILKM